MGGLAVPLIRLITRFDACRGVQSVDEYRTGVYSDVLYTHKHIDFILVDNTNIISKGCQVDCILLSWSVFVLF